MYKMTDAEMVTLRELANEAVAAVKKLGDALASFSRVEDEPTGTPATSGGTECGDFTPPRGTSRSRGDFYDRGFLSSPDRADALAFAQHRD
jgi:hypothetical protein